MGLAPGLDRHGEGLGAFFDLGFGFVEAELAASGGAKVGEKVGVQNPGFAGETPRGHGLHAILLTFAAISGQAATGYV